MEDSPRPSCDEEGRMSGGLIPQRAAIAVADLLDNCAHIQPGQHVLLLCAVDGLHGGRNLVDEQAISWIQQGIQQRRAHASVLWTDMPLHPEVYWDRTSNDVPAWDFPPVVNAAMGAADLLITHLIDYWTEGELRDSRTPNYLYNMATTAPLLTSNWSLTPWELVAEIRVRAAARVTAGAPWTITHPNGTDVRGTVGRLNLRYGDLRHGRFPEGVFPSLPTTGAEGVLIFDTTGPALGSAHRPTVPVQRPRANHARRRGLWTMTPESIGGILWFWSTGQILEHARKREVSGGRP
jgi:hypothetical protein